MPVIAPQAEHRTNRDIRAARVRLVDADGTQLGVVPTKEALRQASELDLDLVEVAGNANPPVCRLMNYGKFKYEEAKKLKDQKRGRQTPVTKEMKYRPKIGIGDFRTKTRKVREFLLEGNRVKVSIMFRGRETQMPELGENILKDVIAELGDIARVDREPALEGRNMTMLLVPARRSAAAVKSG